MLTNRQQHCLKGIGIQFWAERDRNNDIESKTELDTGGTSIGDSVEFHTAEDLPESLPRNAEAELMKPDPIPSATVAADSIQDSSSIPPPVPRLDSWDSISSAIQGCEACALASNCTQKVPGVGNTQADLLIVGEGPGHDEDIRGEPFVGRSGQLLDRMLAAIGISREQVFITNIVKCRPPNNRDPKQDEAQQCRGFLEAQIEQLSPRVILSVGRVSAHNLLASNLPVGKLIKEMHKLPGTDIPLKVTYHPAYLLRNPSAKAIAWQDLKLLHQMLQ